jgi:hypothetical protein
LDVARIRGTPHQVEQLIVNTAQKDGASEVDPIGWTETGVT